MDIEELKKNLKNVFVSRSAILFAISIITFIFGQIFWAFTWEILSICFIIVGAFFCIGAIIIWFEDVDDGLSKNN